MNVSEVRDGTVLRVKGLLLIVLTLMGHFVSSPREREKRVEEIVEEMKEKDREERGTEMKVKKQKK